MQSRVFATIVAVVSLSSIGSELRAAPTPPCDPAGGDSTDVAAIRAAVALACPCAAFKGLSPTTDRKAYMGCVAGQVSSAVGAGGLRKRCAATVTRIFAASVCGNVPGSKKVCVAFDASNGQITCQVKPAGRCESRGTVTRTTCQQDVCLDAADTNGDQAIGAGDTGGCVPIAGSCGDGIRNPGEECDTGTAVCVGGTDAGTPCATDAACTSGRCSQAGNRDDLPDHCRSNCRAPRCGDGVVDGLEQCDDGNTTSGDGCSADCKLEAALAARGITGSTAPGSTITTTPTSVPPSTSVTTTTVGVTTTSGVTTSTVTTTTSTTMPGRKCGVDAFKVVWAKNTTAFPAGPTEARLRIDTTITFTSAPKPPFDPACCEFRQNVKTVFEIVAGPGMGQKGDTSPVHDDNYSRADDTDGKPALDDPGFTTNDNPGLTGLDAMDDLDYSFTAEQIVIDTCNGNAQVQKKGPHTATIKGADPRKYGGVPKTL